MNVKVIAMMQKRNENNHCMYGKSGNLYHFSASKAYKVANMLECSSGSRWNTLPTIRGKE